MSDYELYHSGILGMRWGIRRFQRKDGSLTPEGRLRYRDDKVKGSSKTASKSAPKATVTVAKPKKKSEAEIKAETEAKKKKILESRSAKELYKNANLFNDAELNAAYNRLTLEKNIKSLAPAEVSKGERFADKLIKSGGKLADVVSVVNKNSAQFIALYNNVAKVYNSLSDSGETNPMKYIKTDIGDKKDKDKKDKDKK